MWMSVQPHRADQAGAQGLKHGLLGGKARGQVFDAAALVAGVGLFAGGEAAVEEPLAMLVEHVGDAVGIHEVDAVAENGHERAGLRVGSKSGAGGGKERPYWRCDWRQAASRTRSIQAADILQPLGCNSRSSPELAAAGGPLLCWAVIRSLPAVVDELAEIAEKVERQPAACAAADGLARFVRSRDVWTIGALADKVRRRLHGDLAYYNINRHLNYTNICALSCKFCSFYRKKGDQDTYEYSVEQIAAEAAQAQANGATEIHIVGGLHPYFPFSYYTDMLSAPYARRAPSGCISRLLPPWRWSTWPASPAARATWRACCRT